MSGVFDDIADFSKDTFNDVVKLVKSISKTVNTLLIMVGIGIGIALMFALYNVLSKFMN